MPERRAERVRVGVLVRRDQRVARRGDRFALQRPGTASSQGRRSTLIAAAAFARRLAAALPGGPRAPGAGCGGIGVGSDSSVGGGSRDDPAGLELGEQLEHAGAALDRVVAAQLELRDAPQPDPRAELVAHERHRVLERLHRLLALRRLPDDADPDARDAEVRRGLHVGDRHEPDPRVLDVLGQDRADLLAQQLIDPIGSRSHRHSYRLADRGDKPKAPRGPERTH